MKVLVIGKGGREHAIAHAVSKSALGNRAVCGTGNPGMAQIAENVKISDSDVEGLGSLCERKTDRSDDRRVRSIHWLLASWMHLKKKA